LRRAANRKCNHRPGRTLSGYGRLTYLVVEAESALSNWRRCSVVLSLIVVAAFAAAARGDAPYDQDPIHYGTAPVDDPVSRLNRQIRAGRVTLEHNDRNGYLDAVLKQLRIPVSSQSLVFSRTSFQRDRISPKNPRALYFDDDTYVGWVRGGDVLELAATDPKLGTIFYTLDQRKPAGGAAAPTFQRQTHACLQCHGSTMTKDTPGLLVRSVFPDADGQPILSAGTFLTTQQSPWSERWGGWYVTGTYGEMRHMGNAVCSEADVDKSLDRAAGANVTDLAKHFDVAAYPDRGSDVVALLVLEHQAETHNLLTRANYQARLALRDQEAMNRALSRPGDFRSDGVAARIESAGEALVRQMLFADEKPLTDEVKGTSAFAQEFEARGPRDAMGRSLRDLDLKRRLFRYPLSYLIYSESFDALPAEVKQYVYQRLWQVLTSDDEDDPDFAHLKRSQRRAIREILAETKKDLPAYWKPQ
jgi:hypothetical protein